MRFDRSHKLLDEFPNLVFRDSSLDAMGHIDVTKAQELHFHKQCTRFNKLLRRSRLDMSVNPKTQKKRQQSIHPGPEGLYSG